MMRKFLGSVGIGGAVMLLFIILAVPMLVAGGMAMLFAGGSGGGCPGTGNVAQPGVSAQGKNSIPANYLHWYQVVGKQYGVPWTILAGIGTVESDNGQSNLPGVHSGQNGFGAAGPMQIGIGGASTNTWGGAPIHPASEVVAGVATDEDGKGVANVYDPADAIAGAAKYLIEHGVRGDPSAAIFAYNHLDSYVADVEGYASAYASGGYTVSQVNPGPGMPGASGVPGVSAMGCAGTGVPNGIAVPNAAVATAINFAQQQIGKPYLWGGTGPDAFDCSGLVMMAYRAAGISIARTSQQQWATEQRVPASQVEPGDLVFFAGSDGTPTAPGHVGLVIAKNTMIEAYAVGFPIRVSHFGTASSASGDGTVVGFTNPWAGQAGTTMAAGPAASPAASPSLGAAGPAASPAASPSLGLGLGPGKP